MKLARKIFPLVALLAVLSASAPAAAHHILGIPHYAYDEDYPQAPVLTYTARERGYELKVTGYPGVLKPGDRSSLHVYVRDLQKGEPLNTKVTLTVRRDTILGADPVIYGPSEAELEEAIYKFHPRFELEANYMATIEFDTATEPWTVDVPMVVGEPGSPWVVLATGAGFTLIFLVVIRALRVKLQRRRKQEANDLAGAQA